MLHDHTPFISDAAPPECPLELPRLRSTPPFETQAGESCFLPDLEPFATVAPAGTPAGRPATCALPSLPGLGGGGSLQAILQCRLEQIEKWGHTPEKDCAQQIAPFLTHMLHEVHSYSVAASDDHRGRVGIAQIRKRLVKLGALVLATIDRIDMEAAASSSEAISQQGLAA